MNIILSYVVKDKNSPRRYAIVAHAGELESDEKLYEFLADDKHIRKNRSLFLVAFNGEEHGQVLAFSKCTNRGVAVIDQFGVWKKGVRPRRFKDKMNGLNLDYYQQDLVRRYWYARNIDNVLRVAICTRNDIHLVAWFVFDIVSRISRKIVPEIQQVIALLDRIQEYSEMNKIRISEMNAGIDACVSDINKNLPVSLGDQDKASCVLSVLRVADMMKLDPHHGLMLYAYSALEYAYDAENDKTKMIEDIKAAKDLITIPEVLFYEMMIS